MRRKRAGNFAWKPEKIELLERVTANIWFLAYFSLNILSKPIKFLQKFNLCINVLFCVREYLSFQLNKPNCLSVPQWISGVWPTFFNLIFNLNLSTRQKFVLCINVLFCVRKNLSSHFCLAYILQLKIFVKTLNLNFDVFEHYLKWQK